MKRTKMKNVLLNAFKYSSNLSLVSRIHVPLKSAGMLAAGDTVVCVDFRQGMEGEGAGCPPAFMCEAPRA